MHGKINIFYVSNLSKIEKTIGIDCFRVLFGKTRNIKPNNLNNNN